MKQMSLLLSLAIYLAGCGGPGPDSAVLTPKAPSGTPEQVLAAPAAAPATVPAAAAVNSQDPVVQAIVKLERSDSHARAYLEGLVAFGPRLSSSHNLTRAEAWARDQFSALGLESRLESWGAYPVGFDRGPSSGRMLEPRSVTLDFTTPSWTPGVFGPVRGQAIVMPTSVRAAKALKGAAKNSWVVLRKGDAKLAKRKAIVDKLVELGVAGFIHRARDPAGKLVHTFGRHRVDWASLPRDVEIYLRGDQFDAMVKELGGKSKVTLEFSIDNRFFRGPVRQHNVIADLRGTEKPDEYIIIGGHIDSWDGAVGAVDNGTGVATTLEAARLLVRSGAKPKRTIRFMLWSGEEQGLHGSRRYVEQHPELMDKISVVLVHDGGTNYLSGLTVTPDMATQAKKVFAPVFDLAKDKPFGLFYGDGLLPGGSDHNPFIAAGVPGFFWNQEGKANYSHSHHTQFDTLEAVVDEYQRHSSMVVAIAAWGFAQADTMLDRTDSSPVVPARSAQGIEVEGTTFLAVKDTSDAYKMGFRAGDKVLQVNGAAVDNIYALARAVMTAQGDTISFVIKRKGKKRKLVAENGTKKLAAERKARRARRAARYGELEYGELFAGREKPSRMKALKKMLLGGKTKAKPAAQAKTAVP